MVMVFFMSEQGLKKCYLENGGLPKTMKWSV